MKITSLEALKQKAITIGPQKICVANPAEEEIFHALAEAYHEGIISGYLVGDAVVIQPLLDQFGLANADFEIVHEPEEFEAAMTAVKLVRQGKAGFLMKGTVPTAVFLKAVLDKEGGLRAKGHLLSHVAIVEVPGYSHLLLLTDAAFNIKPSLEEKAKIIDNAIKVANVLGIERPKVACVAAVEKVNPKIPSTVEARQLQEMCAEGRFPGAVVEGPFGLDNAVDPASAEIKGIKGEVAGQANVILAPDMDSGNVIYKALTILAKATIAAIVVGTTAPVILTSRADSAQTKLLSIALGALDAYMSSQKS